MVGHFRHFCGALRVSLYKTIFQICKPDWEERKTEGVETRDEGDD